MQISCPSCASPIPSEECNIQSLVAKCPACGNIFSFGDQVVASQAPRPIVQRPSGVQVSGSGEVLTLTQRWFNIGVLFLAFFAFFWDGMLIVAYTVMLTSNHVDPKAFLFPLIHVAVGVLITYICLCGFVNSTIVTVTRRDVSIAFKPLPFFGACTLEIAQVDQFYSEEIRGSKGSRSYTLSALLKNGQRKRLLGGLSSPDVALFFEQTLEQWFGLEDRPVDGELAR